MDGVKATIDIREAQRVLGALEETVAAGLREGIADGIFAMTRDSFERQASPEGAAWAPLSPKYLLRKQKRWPGRNILQFSGAMLRTLIREVQGNLVIVGSNLPYAPVHQFGSKKKSGRGSGIPARPWLPSEETAAREAQRLGEEILEDAIRQAGGGKS
jgi:phage virion morphogenesis protein